MDSNINNIHDKFVKEMFSNKELAIAFLESYLPENVRNELDLNSLVYANNSYINNE